MPNQALQVTGLTLRARPAPELCPLCANNKGNHVKYTLRSIVLLFLGTLLGCASLMEDDLNAITAFSPYITKDGKQSFRFVAKNKLPSYYKDADIQQTHETWISNELGKRQYCTKGYEIVSKTNAGDDNIIYEGVCK